MASNNQMMLNCSYEAVIAVSLNAKVALTRSVSRISKCPIFFFLFHLFMSTPLNSINFCITVAFLHFFCTFMLSGQFFGKYVTISLGLHDYLSMFGRQQDFDVY